MLYTRVNLECYSCCFLRHVHEYAVNERRGLRTIRMYDTVNGLRFSALRARQKDGDFVEQVVRPSSRVSLKGKRGSVTYPKPLAIGAFLRVDVWLLVAHHTTALLLYQRKYSKGREVGYMTLLSFNRISYHMPS